jgi:cytochrome c-type biogenesis protein CcmH
MRAAAALFLLFLSGPGFAVDIPPDFSDAAMRERYESLLEELRCLVCQNQSLADSAAPLAQDLRDEVAERIRMGESDEEVVAFLVARYGDFVLYRPPFRAETWLLWLGPFILLIAAAVIVIRIAAGRRAAEPPPLCEEERQRLHELGIGREGEP